MVRAGVPAIRLFVCPAGPSPVSREESEVHAPSIALHEVEELQKLVQHGQEKGFLTYDEIVAGLEEVDLTKEQIEDFYTYLIDHSIELVEGEQYKSPPHSSPLSRGREDSAEARPHRRALARLAAPLPPRDRQGAALDRRSGDLSREADRAGRHGGEDPDDRGAPASSSRSRRATSARGSRSST